jgi:glycerol kinase
MNRDSGVPLVELKADGGAVKNSLLMQLQSDILGVPVTRPLVNETTALGAAYAAGLAIGFWNDPGELRANNVTSVTFSPAISDDRRNEGYEGWKLAIEKSRGWIAPKN